MTALQEKEKKVYETLYKNVPEYNKSYSPGGSLLPLMLDIIPKHVKTALCAGCGRGQEVELFKKHGYDVKGVDLTLSGLNETADKRLYHEHPISTMPFEDNAFDLVWCVDVLEHIPNEDRELSKSIKELHRVCKDIGVVSVALFKDGYGRQIGETLHKSIMSADNWIKTLKVVFKDVIELDKMGGNLILWLKK